jgi:Protein of unknown function (DUF3768)
MVAPSSPQRRREAIAALNDALRRSFLSEQGRMVLTRGVAALPPATLALALDALRRFDTFTPDNDPYGEHDFAAFTVEGHRFNFKIDYYENAELRFGAEDPLVAYRVLTLMLAEEY